MKIFPAIDLKDNKSVRLSKGKNESSKIFNVKLKVGNQLSQKADLIISEIFSSELVGEGVQTSILDAKKR